jgi:hypothetical protein
LHHIGSNDHCPMASTAATIFSVMYNILFSQAPEIYSTITMKLILLLRKQQIVLCREVWDERVLENEPSFRVLKAPTLLYRKIPQPAAGSGRR